MNRINIKSTTLICIVSLYFATVLNLSFWRYITHNIQIDSPMMLLFAFSLGIFLAQYLLPTAWLLPMAAAAFILALGRLVLRNDWGRRALLVGIGLSFAFGWNWLYIRQVQAPMEALADTEQPVTMTI